MSDRLVVAGAEAVAPLSGLGACCTGRCGGGVGDDRGVLGGTKHRELAREPVHLGREAYVSLSGIAHGGWDIKLKRTTASCSFSSCRCRSAAVKGRGWRTGPGPGPTPVLSPIGGPAKDATAGNWGEGRAGEPEALTAAWFEGRMLSEGDSGAGGGGIWWEDARRDEVARK